MTTKTEIARWFQEGVSLGATHLIVVCDTFDHEDYPVYVKQDENAKEESPDGYPLKVVRSVEALVDVQYRGHNMQQVMEVYRLSDPMNEQLAANRCYRI